jgi:hypothetical protein
MNRTLRFWVLTLSAGTATTLLSVALASGRGDTFDLQSGFSIDRFTVDGGGGTSTGGSFAISGTIGQPDAGSPLSGGSFELRGGFWPGAVTPVPKCPADVNSDSLVNIDDLIALITHWGACPVPPAECPADVNFTGAVDIDDLVVVITGWGSCP